MLYPQSNPFRQQIDLSGFWELRFDPDNEGYEAGWSNGFENGRPVAVPASWNEQFEDGRDYLSYTWYQTTFDLPWGWNRLDQRLRVHFESVNYLAEVWLNGTRLGRHEGGHLPFEFEINEQVLSEGNRLVVRVDGNLAPERVPPGNRHDDPFWGMTGHPASTFDFFPFCGIHRPVLVYITPNDGISDLTVITEIAGNDGVVRVRVDRQGSDPVDVRIALYDTVLVAETQSIGKLTETISHTLHVPNARFWAPASPHLYDLVVELRRDGSTFDRYTLPIGIRTIAVQGDQLLLNGEPIYLRGFGRHEDFPIAGRGLVPPVIIKDYGLMQWIGANSFRTSHYPYSEAMMRLADQLGVLIIDETPAVGLYFDDSAADTLPQRLELCRQYVREMVARDKNHPSVIMWSLANEPHSQPAAAKPFFRDLYDLARSLDSSRPITLASHVGVLEEAFEFLDVMCLNRYLGWYSQPGQLELALPLLSQELDALYERYKKPLIMT
ncbi:MAG: beta galactosidase jelly roll domain-containing protein, partial [Anaerolineae bacterium]|nr:beta galactosidase jelly roll domain-containing protein [Anaerolineae bacterium]